MKQKKFLILSLLIFLVTGGFFAFSIWYNAFSISEEEYARQSQELVEQSIQSCDCIE
ncbi:hypothetical protein [Propionispira raffinosivorans]|uniref:hypothetical protein n=1 Tax=Propionispira raffinosivorans TaxID=86959 RepID=UPI000367BCAF|nr:hypothetical protein [Propionispira raffinosivorans]